MMLPPHERGDGTDVSAYAPMLRIRARELIGTKLRKLVASSDLIQETLLIAVKRIHVISELPRGRAVAWLKRVMQIRLLRYLRKHRLELANKFDGFSANRRRESSAPALKEMILVELREEVCVAIEELPEPERSVILSLYKEKQTVAEIAARLGKTEGALRAIHQRGVKRLRKRFADTTEP